MELFSLKGEVAVVIGATGVLGGALADGLAAAGAKVAVLGRNEERGNARVKAIKDAGGSAAFFTCDASSRASLAEAHKKIEAALGAPTILVNAAGGNDPKVTVTAENPFENISLEALNANLDLNYIGGAFLPCQEFGPAMTQARQRQHHQHRQRVGAFAAVARDELFGGKGGGAESFAISRARMGHERRAREHHHARIFSGGTKSQVAVQRGRFTHGAHEGDLGSHADESFRRIQANSSARAFFSRRTRRVRLSRARTSAWTAVI